jgi:formylglycine-generating enzyme required for sulfatase activity
MRAHLEQPTRALQPLVSGLSPEFAALIHLMLAKEPERRPTMSVLAERLQFQLAALPRETTNALEKPVSTPPSPVAPRSLPIDTRSLPKLRAPRAVPSRRRRWLLGLGSLGLLTVATGAGLYYRTDRTTRTAQSEPSRIAPTGMLYLPGGRIRLGSTTEEIDEAFGECKKEIASCQRAEFERELNGPEVEVSGFFLDIYEVTNEMFARWLNNPVGTRIEVEGNIVRMDGVEILNLHAAHSGLRYNPQAERGARFSVVEGRGNHPGVQVTFAGADEYCKSRGFRLPSEPEWELAARGTERRRYPWGNDPPRCKGVVIGRWQSSQFGHGPCKGDQRVTAVGTSFQDVTPLGIFDLGGNAEEWIGDLARFPYQAAAEQGSTKQRIVRGGSWNDTLTSARGAGRSRWLEGSNAPQIGFRCATGASQ